MQEGSNTSAVRLQTPDTNVGSGLESSPAEAGGVEPANTNALQVQAPAAGKSPMDMVKSMTAPDFVAGVALVVGIILVMRHFGWKKAGRAADDNLAHLEQARLLAQAARYQAASDATGERRSSPPRFDEGRLAEGRRGEGRPRETRASRVSGEDDRVSRGMDEKIERLQRLIAEADRRIRRLEELDGEARGPRMSIAPAGATLTSPKLAAPRETSAEARGPQAAKSMGEPAKIESRLIEPRAQEATPDDWQSRTRQLAAAGLSAREIAFKLGKPIGHVELVLALQRGQIAG
jgi:hypothetical protein